MGISNPKSTPLSAMKILKAGIKLSANNLFNLLHPILILSYLSSSLLFDFNKLFFTPLITNITTNFLGFAGKAESGTPESSAHLDSMMNYLKEFCTIGFLYTIASFGLNSLLTIATIHLLSASSTLKNVMSTIRRSMITQLYVALFTVAYVLSLLLLAGVLSLFYMYSEQKMVIVAFGVIVALVALHLYLYLAMVWMMSVVISVVNEGCYGLEGIAQARKLLRGRGRQAIFIVFMEFFAVELVHVVYHVVYKLASCSRRDEMVEWVLVVGHLAIGVVGDLFIRSVHTIYYYECNKIDSENIATNRD